jgi:uncharacterized membrane protein YhhN
MDAQGRLARGVLAAALTAGVSYAAASSLAVPEAADTAWKGAGVGLLAIYAGLRARGPDGWLLCAVMAFGALGDVLLEIGGLTTGALAFLAGHLVAIGLYLKNRRAHPTRSQLLLAACLVPATGLIAWLLPADRAAAPGVTLYALGLGLMAACAWISRFPRYRTGIGAVMFVASDLLIFARMGPLAGAPGIDLAVWGFYFFGQVLICLGVVGVLASDRDH